MSRTRRAQQLLDSTQIGLGDEPVYAAAAVSDKPLTGPGRMMAAERRAAESETTIADLREQLKEHAGAGLKLDPKTVRPSRFSNRHAHNFTGPIFEAFRAEIRAAEGNVQAILVRSLKPAEGDFEYEVVFGHRRHRACLEEGLPVLAVVAQISDQALVAAMERGTHPFASKRPSFCIFGFWLVIFEDLKMFAMTCVCVR